MKNQSKNNNAQPQSIKSQSQKAKPSGSVKADQQVTPQKQQGGYSSEPEQKETNREQENMHSERNLGELNADRQEAKPQETEKPAGKAATGKKNNQTSPGLGKSAGGRSQVQR